MEFKDQVKILRTKMVCSQQELAKELGVSFPTINRWENGRSEPHFIVRRAFNDLCKKYNITFEG